VSQSERYGTRDLTYSAWHRCNSTGRFVGLRDAKLLTMIDADVILYVEYDDATKEPLVLIEEARDVEQAWKPASVTQNLARKAALPAFTVLWTPSQEQQNPAAPGYPDIAGFRIKRIWPSPESSWSTLTPQQWPPTNHVAHRA
jgi:hypothetical protein